MIPRCDRFIYKLWKLPFEEIVFIGAWTQIGHRPSLPPYPPTPTPTKSQHVAFFLHVVHVMTYDLRILSWLCLGRGEGGVIWAFLIILQKYFLIKQWTYSVFVQNFISVGRVYMYLILFYEEKKIHNMIVAHVQATVWVENRFFCGWKYKNVLLLNLTLIYWRFDLFDNPRNRYICHTVIVRTNSGHSQLCFLK